ncbi:MAG: F-type H+-transporting ATPase subunit delta [Planctomycetota bacterium]
MIIDPVTMRYTEALFGLATDLGIVDQIRAEVDRLNVEVSDETVGAWLFDARIPQVDRRAQLDKVTGEFHEILRNFVGLLFDRNREVVLHKLSAAFRAQWLASRGSVEGHVESALALDAAEISELSSALGARLGKEVILENRINSDLVGGVRVFVDNKLIDYSAKGRLEGLRRKMMECELPALAE